jgi:putative spermidine/putrescine transport system permease protein
VAIAQTQGVPVTIAARERDLSLPHYQPDERLKQLQRRQLLGYLALLLPSVILLAIFFVYPIIRILYTSLLIDGAFSLDHYRRLFEVEAYLRVLRTTLTIGLQVTVICLLIGYPLAYFLSTLESKWSRPLLILVLIPFWTSFLVRTYAWMVLLQRRGVINQWLMDLGLTSEPIQMIYNRMGVLIGMVHVLLPFMVLPLYAVMAGIDRDLLRAAQNLGATPFQAFRRVFFPLSLPGVAAGSILVFILAIGFYITPALMGGRRDTMIAQLIERQVREQLNFEFAAAIAALLLVVTIVIFLIYNRVLGLERVFGGDSRG